MFVASACSTFSGAEEDAGGAAAADSGTGDAETDPPEASPDALEAAPAGMNLLQNGDFELGCEGLGGPNVSTVREDPPPHTGTTACRVCPADAGGYALLQSLVFDAQLGHVITASSWVRAASDASVPGIIETTIATYEADAATPLSQRAVLNGVPTAEYVQMTGSLRVDRAGAARLALRIGPVSGASGSCFVIDDIVLVDTTP